MTDMELLLILDNDKLRLELLKNRQVIDIETAKYYHDISEVLTPLEVTDIIRKGFVTRGDTVIYKELLTGLITSLDKLLKRNKVDPIRLLGNNRVSNSIKTKSNGAGFKAIKIYKIQGDLGDNSTSYKIASAFIGALKFRDRS